MILFNMLVNSVIWCW